MRFINGMVSHPSTITLATALPEMVHIAEMGPAFEAGQVCDEKLSAPNLTVGSIAGAVERHANHVLAQMVLGHTGGDVSVMVLHPDPFQSIQFLGESGTEVIGMQVMDNHARLHAEQLLHLLQRFAKELEGLVVLQVADMLAEQRVAALSEIMFYPEGTKSK